MTKNSPLLDVLQIDAATDQLPRERRDALKELRVGYMPDPAKFLSFVARCPNITTLFCDTTPKDALPTQVQPQVLPFLKKFKGSLDIAKLFVPGRPLEDLIVTASFRPRVTPATFIEVIPFLATGTGKMHHLRLGTFTWREGTVEKISALFPDLESLVLDVDPPSNPERWLEEHLVEVVSRLKDLRKISLWHGGVQLGPLDENRLEQQLQVLQEARMSQHIISSVSFQQDITWEADIQGRWTATYFFNTGRKMILFSPLDYLPAEEVLGVWPQAGDHKKYQGPGLPAEILIQIVASLASTRTSIGNTSHALTNPPSTIQLALKNLSLANHALRSVAQPVIFHRIELSGTIPECLVRARKILKMVQSREESCAWIKILRLNWPSYQNRRPLVHEIAKQSAQLVATVSQLFCRLTHLATFQADGVQVLPEMYTHLFELPTLRTLRLARVNLDPTDLPNHATENLRIEDFDVNSHGQPSAVTMAVSRFARSPSLLILKIEALSDGVLVGLLGDPPQTLPAVTEIRVNLPGVSFDRILALASACPNLRSIFLPVPGTANISPPLQIPNAVAPLLRKIAGPLDAVMNFVPARPVTYIKVLGPAHETYEWSKELLAPLALGSAPVHELELQWMKWREDGMNILSERFPNVEVLKAHFLGEPQPYLQEHLLDEVRRFKKLRIIHLRLVRPGFHFDGSAVAGAEANMEQKEREILYAALELGSELVEVSFEEGKTWRLKEGKGWQRDDPMQGQNMFAFIPMMRRP